MYCLFTGTIARPAPLLVNVRLRGVGLVDLPESGTARASLPFRDRVHTPELTTILKIHTGPWSVATSR